MDKGKDQRGIGYTIRMGFEKLFRRKEQDQPESKPSPSRQQSVENNFGIAIGTQKLENHFSTEDALARSSIRDLPDGSVYRRSDNSCWMKHQFIGEHELPAFKKDGKWTGCGTNYPADYAEEVDVLEYYKSTQED